MLPRSNSKIAEALEFIKRMSHPVQRANYKGVRGRIGIVGGARDYAGAPYFASISAMRLGADLTYVICSKEASQPIKSYSPELIVVPLLDASESDFNKELNCLMQRLHALVIGPGLGRDKLLQERAKRLIQLGKSQKIPLVLDADSLLLVNEDPNIIKSYPLALLTPNRVELERLANNILKPKTFDFKTVTASANIREVSRECSKFLDVTILAKGQTDLINNPKVELEVGEFESGSNRRCGGQGDILAGMAGVYLHWLSKSNLEVEDRMAVGAFLAAVTTRVSNELAYKEFGMGMLASHMIEKLPQAFKSILHNTHQLKSTYSYSGTMKQDEIKRYSRQMIMDEFGPQRQTELKKASAVIVGAGGLGCPSSVYLAGAGIGRLGIVDDDVVEASNLHRQILHTTEKIGMLKTESIKEYLDKINPNVVVETHSVKFSRENGVKLIENYDIVIDATDNLLTRYLVSDACVVAKKPLVSGAALKMDGQLTVYNYDAETPCFRCLFPEPPPSNAVGSCTDNGVLGVVPGVIGVQMALEAIKIASGLRPAYAGRMLLFDGLEGSYRNIKLSKRRLDCAACGPDSKLGPQLIDYEGFCGIGSCSNKTETVKLLQPEQRISVEEYSKILLSGRPHLLIDVRPKAHSDLSRLAHAVQIPLAHLMEEERSRERIEKMLKENGAKEIYVVCRRGIASQRGAQMIGKLLGVDGVIKVRDIVGGMTAWAREIDSSYSCL